MFERLSYPAGVPCWVETMQPDPEAAARVLPRTVRLDVREPLARTPKVSTGSRSCTTSTSPQSAARLHPILRSCGTRTPPSPARKSDKKAQAAGGTVLTEPVDAMDAGRYATFADPEGATFSVWQAGQTIGAKLVNEPGTWNFSELNTRDREAAAAFYGSVFGWEADTFSMGETDFTIFKLHGYGAFLMQNNPDLQGNVEADGAPGGFINNTLIQPLTDDGPAHWSVTFTTDDADAAASRG